MNENDIIDIITASLQVIILIAGYFIFSYLKEKGKNAATKEDIINITDKVESVKDLYIKSQTRFTKLHELRVEYLVNFYKDLRKFHSELQIELHKLDNPSDTNKRDIYIQTTRKITEFDEKYRDNDILFTDEFSNYVNDIFKKYFDITMNIRTSSEIQAIYSKDVEYAARTGVRYSNISTKKFEETFEKVNNAWKSFNGEILILREKIKKEIKNMFGII